MILVLAQAALAGDWLIFRYDAMHSGTSDEVVEPPLNLLRKYITGSWCENGTR
jgi:hypothetical protein